MGPEGGRCWVGGVSAGTGCSAGCWPGSWHSASPPASAASPVGDAPKTHSCDRMSSVRKFSRTLTCFSSFLLKKNEPPEDLGFHIKTKTQRATPMEGGFSKSRAVVGGDPERLNGKEVFTQALMKYGHPPLQMRRTVLGLLREGTNSETSVEGRKGRVWGS